MAQTSIGLNHVTVWRWRHRFLQASANDNADLLRGVIEVDETMFRRSFKGSRTLEEGASPKTPPAHCRPGSATRGDDCDDWVPVLTALDRSGAVVQAILASLKDIETVLCGHIDSGSILCAPDRAVYIKVADVADAEARLIPKAKTESDCVEMNPVRSPNRDMGRLGLRRVQQYHRHLRHLINERCRGVATKYSGRYLRWHRAMAQSGFDGKALLVGALAVPMHKAGQSGF